MKINKKGFTLVELLAVIVILALLIVIVANTAIPAMNNAKKKSLETYAQKVVQKAKENCAAEKMAGMGDMCKKTAGTVTTCCGTLTVAEIMGEENTTYSGSVTVSYDATNNIAKVTSGTISDKDNEIDVTSNSITPTTTKKST